MFLLLEITAGGLIVSNNSYQRSKFISASNGITGNILSLYDNINSYFYLRNINKQLASENARLHNILSSSYLKHDTLSFEVNDSIYKQRYRFMEAKVIGNSFQKRNNYLILSKGKNQGIYEGMGVISPEGLVGIVNSVSNNFSSVISVLHSKSAVDVKLKKTGYTGTLTWDGKNYRLGTLNNIPSHVDVKEGDTVITSGFSSIFPEGIMVGTVKDIKKEQGVGFYDITVKFSVNYNKVEYVYVVFNLLKDEEQSIREKGSYE